ncbi:MAG: DNA translocase FtsK 4TM domain-containing protein [Planctomycetes bacterium]|nr:DNA translocase FtsK 4TM domain-containing protein [Planctomycetota bacterium]
MTAASTAPTLRGTAAGPLLGLAAACFLWASILTWNPSDWPNPNHHPFNEPAANACGPAGAWTAHWIAYYVGDGALPMILFITLVSLMKLLRRPPEHLGRRIVGVGLLVVVTSACTEMIAGASRWTLPEGPGGVLGLAVTGFLRANVSNLGAILVLGYLFLVGLMLAAAGWGSRMQPAVSRLWRASVQTVEGIEAAAGTLSKVAVAVAGPVHHADRRSSADTTQGDRGDADRDDECDSTELLNDPKPRVTSHRRRATTDSAESENQGLLFDEGDEAEATDPGRRSRRTKRARARKAKQATAGHGAASHGVDTEQPTTADAYPDARDDDDNEVPVSGQATIAAADPSFPGQMAHWHFPSVTLLDEPTFEFTDEQELVVRAKAKTLERTLEDFRVAARVVQIDTGPVITMFELQLAAGVKVSQIAALSNDIARALRATSVRVVAPIPGKNTVGIEIPNPDKEIVQLKDLLTFGAEKSQEMALPLFLGKDASGAPLIHDLARMPHLLIAGTTGSGKSVCINSLLAGFLMTQRPDRLKLILADPKMVELARFKDIPHLMCPIVTDAGRAGAILEWAVTKMQERYALLAEAGVRNLPEYNDLGEEELLRRLNPSSPAESAQIPKHLPYLVIVIDELADLMMTSASDVEHHLCRLAQKSRAVGIHIIVATQRPEARVVTGLIKSNMPCRIAFRVASRIDSRIVLDQNGAEVLMGQGDMLFLPPGSAKPIRAQGTFVSDRELAAILDDLAGRIKPKFHPELIRLTSTDVTKDEARDPLFDQAVRIVLETGRGSVSLIQRRLNIGYSRASRLIDQMTDAGIVGDFKGSQAREVMITAADWESIRRRANREDAEQEELDQKNQVTRDEEAQDYVEEEDDEDG